VAALGFNVMHDGSHQAYSRTRPWINGAMAASLDLLGGSSYVWNWKHNVFHHTYPNIEGLDDDIAVSPMARLAPSQPRYRFHSLQWLYMWGLYSFLALKWHFLDDFLALATGRLGGHRFPRPRRRDLVLFAAGKLLWLTWMVVLPLLLLDWTTALLFFLVTEATTGFVLSVVFQLAHCVEEAQFEALPGEGQKLRFEFAAHQLRSTVDFAPGNRLLTWFVGGLNYQAVHHLFPRVCHVHYPALSRIVGEVSAEFGVAYHVNATFRRAVASHFRWLRRMGRPVASAA
jgi:linoleoyl-CoA desaturase